LSTDKAGWQCGQQTTDNGFHKKAVDFSNRL